MCRIDDGVVSVASLLCYLALLKPDLVAGVDHKREFGVEFRVEAFPCFEGGSHAVYHCL